MTHFKQLINIWRLNKDLKSFIEEKENELCPEESEFDSDVTREVFLQKTKTWCENNLLKNFLINLITSGTIENIVRKSFLAFIGGIMLTYGFFFFFHVGVNFSLKTTTQICGLTGIILCFGLAFSSSVRCHVFLLLPVFFSKQGRQALLAYALFLAITGPARNTMHNIGILTDSMVCGQEMVRRSLRQISDMVKVPIKSVKETLQKIMKAVKDVVDTFKSFVMKLKRMIVSILSVIKKAGIWWSSIINICNKKIGTPFQRCMKTFDDGIADCKAKLGILDFLCHVVHVVKDLCYAVKGMDFVCLYTEFASDRVVSVVKKKLKKLSEHIKNLFYVSVEFSHSCEFETTASNSTNCVARTILQKTSKKVEKLQAIFGFFGFVFGFFFLFVFYKAYYYKCKFLCSDRYDNIYISKYIIELDLQRARMERETVLPLEPREEKIYAKPTAIRLVKEEKNRMAQSMFLLNITSFKVISFVLIDYSLFWVLITMYEAGRDMVYEVEKSKVELYVDGDGVLAEFYTDMGKAFRIPENSNLRLDRLHCLPDPSIPDTDRYIQIGFLIALCWILSVTEPYGLRLRNVVMSHYYPDRARERAVWLYNHILRSRGSFTRFARRQLRKKFQVRCSPVEKATLAQRLFVSFPLLSTLFGKNEENACLLCEASDTDTESLKRCKTPDCPGKYCTECFATLLNVCTICQHPIDYGDVSDISEETDSSEEEYYEGRRKCSEVFYDEDSISEDKFMTFSDLELRDRFKDLEANRMIDYAKLGDLYTDKAALKKRLKEVLIKRLQNLEKDGKRSKKFKQIVYKRLKSKLQNLITKIKQKRSEQMAIKKIFISKIKFLKNKGKKEGVEYVPLTENENPNQGATSFNEKKEKCIAIPRTKCEYEKLKNKVKETIKIYQEKTNLELTKIERTNKKELKETCETYADETLLREEKKKEKEEEKKKKEEKKGKEKKRKEKDKEKLDEETKSTSEVLKKDLENQFHCYYFVQRERDFRHQPKTDFNVDYEEDTANSEEESCIKIEKRSSMI